MQTCFRSPQVEEGRHNIILQNRCGNRLTLLFHENDTELEFVYKPNACRRKEFRARNFSNRDNFTKLFRDVRLPQIMASSMKEFDYDPFITNLETEAPSRARNRITVVNVADENVFAVAARCPLLFTFTPHDGFVAEDGLLYEKFTDRGEEIVSFVVFRGFEENRYRVLDDGRHVLQIMDDDLLLFGGEENEYQMRRVVSRLGGLPTAELIEQTEEAIAPVLARGNVEFGDPDFQRVIDLNRRVMYSGIDEGGASFGALNRIYHLIWNRDGAMTTALTAFAGNPEIVKVWAPFILRNPSRRGDEGGPPTEYTQLLGTRWSKHEDDGIYYAALSLFAHHQTTGDDALLHEAELQPLVDALEHHIAARLDEDLGIFGSDTRGETTLVSSDHFGYDTVNGLTENDSFHTAGGKDMVYSYSLYHNVNMYNVFRILETLVVASPDVSPALAAKCRAWGDDLETAIMKSFVDPDTGCFFAGHLVFADGSHEWQKFEEGCDYWEHAWAVSVGPYFPCLRTALRSARAVRDEWPGIRSYGYAPWNTLSRMLKEFGLSSADYKAMLADEVREALMLTEKYPMKGAFTEYFGEVEGWRALPFSAGTFLNSVSALILAGLPAGLAVRASDLVERVTDYAYLTSRIDATSSGAGDTVASATVNGAPLVGTLQIPETLLRTGRNEVRIVRGDRAAGPRLFWSDARLLAAETCDGALVLRMTSAARSDLVFEGLGAAASVAATDADGNDLPAEVSEVEDTGKSVVALRPTGDFTVTVRA